MKFLILFFLTLSLNLVSCKHQAFNHNVSQLDLDKAIKCSDNSLAYDGNFHYPDYGCVYGKDNHLGNVQVYLFPVTDKYRVSDADYKKQDKLSKELKNLPIEEIKNNFDIFIQIIDKKYLIEANNLDTPYIIQDDHVKEVYYFDKIQNKWLFLNSTDLNQESLQNIEIDPNGFYHYFLITHNRKISKDIDFSISKKWYGTYSHSSYETADNGVGYGIEYTINITKNSCNIDMVGTQTDKHFSCRLEDKDGSLVIFDENGGKFGVLNKKKDKYYLKIVYHNEEPDEVPVDFTK